MAEHSAVNRRVVGSSPTWGASRFTHMFSKSVWVIFLGICGLGEGSFARDKVAAQSLWSVQVYGRCRNKRCVNVIHLSAYGTAKPVPDNGGKTAVGQGKTCSSFLIFCHRSVRCIGQNREWMLPLARRERRPRRSSCVCLVSTLCRAVPLSCLLSSRRGDVPVGIPTLRK